MGPVLSSIRPRQWTKNLVVFAALFFSEKQLFLVSAAWVYAGIGFCIFCGLSGGVYLLNDLIDREKDKLHPEKRHRPIASGKLPVSEAKLIFIFILIICLLLSVQMPKLFFISALAYFFMNLAYSFWLKNVVILDVLSIAIGFVLRAQAGVGAVQIVDPKIYMSHWLILCTFMLALFLALAKRRQEIKKLKDDAVSHRKILEEYSPHLIDELTGLVCAATIMSYAIYTVSAETIQKFRTDKLVLTVPFVLYGIFRYQYLIHIKNLGDNPSEILLSDRPLQINLVLWLISVVVIIRYAQFY